MGYGLWHWGLWPRLYCYIVTIEHLFYLDCYNPRLLQNLDCYNPDTPDRVDSEFGTICAIGTLAPLTANSPPPLARSMPRLTPTAAAGTIRAVSNPAA